MNRYDAYYTHKASRRLRGYDYAQEGAYLITICTYNRECLFGKVAEGRMELNKAGCIVEEEWQRSTTIRDEVVLDAFVIMPNHIHGIVVIGADNNDGVLNSQGDDQTTLASTGWSTLQHASPIQKPPRGPRAQSLGAFVAGFKPAATCRINRLRNTPGAQVWQRNYHDRILRNDKEWCAARRYIAGNPGRWNDDRNYRTKL